MALKEKVAMIVSSNFKKIIYENFSKKSLFPTEVKQPNLGELTLSIILNAYAIRGPTTGAQSRPQRVE